MRTTYQINRPGKARRTFSLYEKRGDGTYRNINCKELKLINNQLLAGQIDVQRAELLVLDLKRQLFEERDKYEPKVLFNSDNASILESLKKEEYAYKDMESEESAIYDIQRALKIIGHLSLRTASKDELQKKIDDEALQSNAQRRVVMRVHQLLKFIGRSDIKLRKRKPGKHSVHYISFQDFQRMIGFVQDENMRLLITCAFATGMRLGENFAAKSLFQNHIQVFGQMTEEWGFKGTKTKRERRAVIVPEFYNDVQRWVDLPDEIKRTIRNARHNLILKKACELAKVQPVKMGDLRHSYAIYLLQKGVSLSLVSQALGNSIQVCQMFYAGFQLTTESVDIIAQKLKA